jgi:hypothetical protein
VSASRTKPEERGTLVSRRPECISVSAVKRGRRSATLAFDHGFGSRAISPTWGQTVFKIKGPHLPPIGLGAVDRGDVA